VVCEEPEGSLPCSEQPADRTLLWTRWTQSTHILTLYILKMLFAIILPAKPMTAFRGFDYIWLLISELTDACHMSRPCHPPGFEYSTNMNFPVRSPEITCSVTKSWRRNCLCINSKDSYVTQKARHNQIKCFIQWLALMLHMWEIPFSNFGQVIAVLRLLLCTVQWLERRHGFAYSQ
jgi:hypothetical protein